VLLGQGDGTFLPAQSFPAGTGPRSVAVGDFNGDGKLDLAVADYGYYGNGQTVSVLLGNGDGTFQAAQSFPAGTAPNSVAVGDFNGDGKPDLAVANLYSGTVSVLLGNGDGTFLPAVTDAAGVHPSSVAVGDFNGDGILDLAVAGYGGVRVLLGNGNGTFQTTNFSYVPGSVSVAVGRFNGDGFPDLAAANAASNNVSILLNDATWPRGPGRASGGSSHPRFPQRLPPPAVFDFTGGEEPRWAGNALLAGAQPPGDGPFPRLPAPVSPLGAEPPQAVLFVLLGEGRPPGLSDAPARLRARGAPLADLDRLFADLAANGIWDDSTDEGTPLLV
jgi:hypothetical protein